MNEIKPGHYARMVCCRETLFLISASSPLLADNNPGNNNKVIAIFPSEKLIGTRCFKHEVTLQNIRSQMSGNLATAARRLPAMLLQDMCRIKNANLQRSHEPKRCLIYRLMADCWEAALSAPLTAQRAWMFGGEHIWDGLPSL